MDGALKSNISYFIRWLKRAMDHGSKAFIAVQFTKLK